jgi:hypothetical protein
MLLFSCISNDLETPNDVAENVSVKSDLVYAFDHLNKKIGNGDLSTQSQMEVFYDYATTRKLALNLNNASCSLDKKEASLPGVSKSHETIVAADLEMLNSYIINYGTGSQALDLIQDYKLRLEQGAYKGLKKEEIDILKEHVSALEFFSGTAVGKTYYKNISAFVDKQRQKGSSEFRTSASPADCVFYVAMVGYYTYACISVPWPLNIIPCGLLAYYAIKASGCPGGGGTGGGPCAGSTNPCCGITCITGYFCNNGQCVQDPNYNPPSCPDGCFWTGIECACQ